MPEEHLYAWDIFQTFLVGGVCEKFGAGPVVFQALRARHGDEGFLALLEELNEIETGRELAFHDKRDAKKKTGSRTR